MLPPLLLLLLLLGPRFPLPDMPKPTTSHQQGKLLPSKRVRYLRSHDARHRRPSRREGQKQVEPPAGTPWLGDGARSWIKIMVSSPKQPGGGSTANLVWGAPLCLIRLLVVRINLAGSLSSDAGPALFGIIPLRRCCFGTLAGLAVYVSQRAAFYWGPAVIEPETIGEAPREWNHLT
ncbi:hypothetical protein V8C44DRAFT_338470 [Trichoderma aethiopicum]